MKITKVTSKDEFDIWLWKNDKKTIFYSRENNKKISYENHKRWFNKTLFDSKVKFYLGTLKINKKFKKVGVVRFNIKAKYSLVSINLNPKMRGKKLSHILLSRSIKKFLRIKKIKLIAEIKKSNLASIKCFLKNNFFFLKSKKQFNIYQNSLN